MACMPSLPRNHEHCARRLFVSAGGRIWHGGRYAYCNQPTIGKWNLARLAEALLPLVSDDDDEAIALAEKALLESVANLNRGEV